jgi:hypothetical protein
MKNQCAMPLIDFQYTEVSLLRITLFRNVLLTF